MSDTKEKFFLEDTFRAVIDDTVYTITYDECNDAIKNRSTAMMKAIAFIAKYYPLYNGKYSMNDVQFDVDLLGEDGPHITMG